MEISTPMSDLVKNFNDLFSDEQELSLSLPEFNPIPFDIESSDDSGFGSLNGTASSFLSDIINSPSQVGATLSSESPGFKLDTSFCSTRQESLLSFTCGSPVAKQLSFDSPTSSSCQDSSGFFLDASFTSQCQRSQSCGSPVAKQLSFDSPVSSPSCPPEADKLRPRRKFLDDSFEITTAVQDISAENSASCDEYDSACASPTFYRKNESRLTRYSPHHHDNTPVSSTKRDSIKTAFHKEDSTDDLIGDFSRSHSLPTVLGKHQDLKSITADTLAEILTGILVPIMDYKIVDCRYPYEYNGGHIEGALNLHTQVQIQTLLEESTIGNSILIFHCEFSSERGPKRARFLRSLDRQMNAEYYPQLNFPEIYILDGGYKEFFNQYPNLCIPEDYIPMLHAQYKDELKIHRSSAKSWKASKKSLAAKITVPFKY